MTVLDTAQIQVRRGAAAQWTTANPTLALGEIGFETDTNLIKIGDGISAWVSLGYNFVTLTNAQVMTNKDLRSSTNLLPIDNLILMGAI